MAAPGLSDWPSPLSLAKPQSFGLKLGFSIAGHPAYLLVDVLRHPGIITPTVAPERFCDVEVIMKALRCVFVSS